MQVYALRAFPSSTAPGPSAADPALHRYPNPPCVTKATHAVACHSSNVASAGPALQRTSVSQMPGAQLVRRTATVMSGILLG